MTPSGRLVVDAVTHAFNGHESNHAFGTYSQQAMESFFDFQWHVMPEAYRLERKRYFRPMTTEGLASALFVESDTDIAVFHTIPAWGIFHDLSPAAVGLALREMYPGRMLMYGGVSPLEGARALEQLEQQVEDWDIIGLKLYPIEVIDGRIRAVSFEDEDVLFPVLERCQQLGVSTVAIHKAIPLATAPTGPFRPDDVEHAAAAFPDLQFEIVHGGFAFLEETALQLSRFPNIWVNLEGTGAMLLVQPRAFARALGTMMAMGGHERILWGTGAAAFHPQPLIDSFETFDWPDDMADGWGYPELTDDVRSDIFGRNYGRLHGIDVDALVSAIAEDELSVRRRAPSTPWQDVVAVDV